MERLKWSELSEEDRAHVVNTVRMLQSEPLKKGPAKADLEKALKYKHLWQRKITYKADYSSKTGLFTVDILLGNGDEYATGSHKELGAALMIALDQFGQRAIRESHPSYGDGGSGRNLMPYLRPIKAPAHAGLSIYGDCYIPKDVQVAIRENAAMSGHEKVVSMEEFSKLTGIPPREVKNLTISGNLEVLTIPGAGSFVPMEIVNGFRQYWFDRKRPVAAQLSEEYLCAIHEAIVKDGVQRESAAT